MTDKPETIRLHLAAVDGLPVLRDQHGRTLANVTAFSGHAGVDQALTATVTLILDRPPANG